MQSIKKKLRKTKVGSNNPQSKKVKRIDLTNNEETIFDSITSCAKSVGINSGKTSITTRLNGKISKPYKNKYIFEYCDK